MISMWLQSASDFFMTYGTFGLFMLSFAESSFFPVPPDILLIGMSLTIPKLALWYALITTVASVSGGVFGYYIGIKAGRPLLIKWLSDKQIKNIEGYFKRYGGWAVAIAGFTPIPYKVFTISAGVFSINKKIFVIASIMSRGARFFLEGFLIFLIGANAKYFLNNYLEVITISVTLVIIIALFIVKKYKGCCLRG